MSDYLRRARGHAAFLSSGSNPSTPTSLKEGWLLMARRFADSSRFMNRTFCCCPTLVPPSWTRSAVAKTLNVNCFVHDPFTREAYSRDPRNVARKAQDYLESTGIADTAYFGAEAEFYIFDSVQFDSTVNSAFYEVDSIAGWWNTGAPTNADGTPNRGYKVRHKGSSFPGTAV